jgi:sec-independent protein translocase protein TatB
MEILGVGLSEFVFIVIIALIVLGPKDMQKAGRTIGKWLRGIVMSDGWKVFQQTTHELRTLPNKLMRDANEELNQIGNEVRNASSPASNRVSPPKQPLRSQPYSPDPAPAVETSENQIAPPEAEQKENESDQSKNA